MGNYSLKMLFAVFMCILHTQVFIIGSNLPSQRSQVRCIEKERQALLNFRKGLTDDYGMLSTWRHDDNSRDCCKWKGIECNNVTGHVHMLDLCASDKNHLSGAINLTSLLELQYMVYLDLSYNEYINISTQIPEGIGSLQNLIYLNLSNMGLDWMIPHELGNLSKLEYLDLSDNFDIIGNIPYQLGNLSQLRYLDLGYTSLSGPIPFQVGNLPLLHTLRLDGNFDLKISDAKWLSSLSSLTTLDLRELPNLASSHHWLQMVSEHIPSLKKLRLVSCSLSDDNISSLFSSHFNFSTTLSILDLSGNKLTSSTFQLLVNYSNNLQELYLSQNNIVWSSPQYPNFPSLVILDLSYNNLTSSVFQGSFNFCSKLQVLLLENCSLTDKSFLVPSGSIKNSSSSLFTLDLSSNLLKSSAIFHWLFNFTINLHSLSLDENLLEGPIPDGFGKVMNSLEVIYLFKIKLQGKIPVSLGNICTLRELDLSHNNLSGGISSFIQNSSWCKTRAFQTLDLSHNQISGTLPDLSILTYLRRIDLSNNQLTGKIPKGIGLLHELVSLHLEENYLEGEIVEEHFKNLSKLEELDFTDNSLSLKFGTTWLPPFQLFRLRLASCMLGPNFPSWLQIQRRLSFLDISDAGIDDFVPEWFWNKLQSISKMNMSYNSLKGTIPNLPLKITDDQTIILLNSNQLEGGIPGFLSQANSLDLSNNKISDLRTFLCVKNRTSYMETLNLSNNQITGQLPDCWELLHYLEFLDLSNNKLSGKIPQSMGTLVNLQALVLRNNNLTGDLPFKLKNCTNLRILDVSENLLSGSIPSWIGESLQQLEILSLRVNCFFGNISVHLCYLSQIHLLDLSRNNFSGRIPTCLSNLTTMIERFTDKSLPERMRRLSPEDIVSDIYASNVLLMWKGQEQVYWNPEFLLKSIDFSSNDLTGKIPKEVGCLLGLVSLNLSRNNLKGEIPYEIGNLNLLEFLDLSRNHLSGKIPSTLSEIDRLAMLDLSNNDLSGRIPWGRQLQTFDGSSFEGNVGLCGQQLNKSCPGDETTTKHQGAAAIHGEDDNSVFYEYEALYMSLGLGFFTGFWGLLGPILLWQPWRNSYGRLLNRLIDSIIVVVEVNIAKCHRWLKDN